MEWTLIHLSLIHIFWNYENLTLFYYIPSFIAGTLIGGSIAYAFLRKMASNGSLVKLQAALSESCYTAENGVVPNAITIAALGVIFFVVVGIASDVFELTSPVWTYISRGGLIAGVAAAAIYLLVSGIRRVHAK